METVPSIIFYGKNFIPLSNECYGCFHYGTICMGSVYETECRAGIVEDITPSIVANLILRYTDNRFTLARVFDYDIEKEVNQENLTTDELQFEFKEAKKTPDEVIHLYKKIYSIDLHGKTTEEFSSPPVDKGQKEDSTSFEKDGKSIDIFSEDDLPF
jgi:hypothetical protein